MFKKVKFTTKVEFSDKNWRFEAVWESCSSPFPSLLFFLFPASSFCWDSSLLRMELPSLPKFQGCTTTHSFSPSSRSWREDTAIQTLIFWLLNKYSVIRHDHNTQQIDSYYLVHFYYIVHCIERNLSRHGHYGALHWQGRKLIGVIMQQEKKNLIQRKDFARNHATFL